MSYILKTIDREIELSDSQGEDVKKLLLEGRTEWLKLGQSLIKISQIMAVYFNEPSNFFLTVGTHKFATKEDVETASQNGIIKWDNKERKWIG